MNNDVVICPYCNIQLKRDDIVSIFCPECYNIIANVILAENNVENKFLEVLKIGDVVQVTNEDHVWYNEFAIIRGIKPHFYRIEIRGKKTWVPQDWVKINEPDDTNK